MTDEEPPSAKDQRFAKSVLDNLPRQSADENVQAFECEVCDQRYQLECPYPIDKITLDCSRCGEPNAWCFPA